MHQPTSSGADGISARLLQQLYSVNCQKLLSIYNASFENSTLPDSWELATVIPIRKPGKPAKLTSSYRPIALTSVYVKILGRMRLQRLLICVCTLFYHVRRARVNNHFVAAVCLDIKAAYDSIWIENLIYKLETIGIRVCMGRWFAEFLTEHRIQIRWRSTTSGVGPCRHGVPQWSGLSLLLFLVYLADIIEVL